MISEELILVVYVNLSLWNVRGIFYIRTPPLIIPVVCNGVSACEWLQVTDGL
jgi:hypothetical protein